MKKISTIIKASFIVMLLGIISPMVAQVINNNCSFENWTGVESPTPSNWLGDKSTVTASNYAQVTSPVHTGNYACQLINASGNHKRFTTEELSLTGGSNYTISMWVSGVGHIRTALAYVNANSSDYHFGNYNTYDTINSPTGFIHIEQTITAPEGAIAGQFIISFKNTDTTAGHLIIDDVEISEATSSTNFTNIAEFKAATFQGAATIISDVTYVFRSGSYIYVKDNTAGLLIYDNITPIITTTYNEGDIISGGISGTKSTYNNQIELIPTANPAVATVNSGAVTPLAVTIANLNSNYAAYDAQLVTLSDVTLTNDLSFTSGTTGSNVTIEQNGSSINIRNNFKTLDITLATGTVTDVTGFIGIYNNTIQIFPRSNADLMQHTSVVATPTFSPNGGIFSTSVDVTINSDNNTTVYYTTDGTEPTTSSAQYNGTITITSTTTLKAKAFKTDWTPSATATAEFIIVNEPLLAVNPTVLNFSSDNLSQDITINAAFISNPITLTCNDTHFTLSQSTINTPNGNNTITITFDGTEPANGVVTILADTLTAQVALSATAQLPAPIITPTTGTTDTSVVVTISCATPGADIHYTTDGTTPTSTSNIYNAPIELNIPGNYTIKAIAMMSNWENSNIAEATYTVIAIEPQIDDSLVFYTGFEDAEGFTATQVYNNAAEAVSGPTTNSWSTVYGTPSITSPLQGAQSMQMRWYTSAATTLGYTKTNFDIAHATRVKFSAKNSNGMKLSVAHSIDGGNTYSTPVIFNLSSMAEEYTYMVSETGEYDFVRFQFNVVLPETNPTSTSRVYLDSVRFYGMPGMATTTVNTPIITPNSGNFVDTVIVNIACTTSGSQIYYTLDGTTPDNNATLYTGPFNITSTTTVKAIAYAFGYSPSNVVTATYNFPVEVANIAAFKAANTTTNSTVYKIAGDVTFVFSHGANFYIQDSTGGLLIYNNQNIITGNYTEGDVISGGVYGTYTLYNGLVEMIPSRNLAASTSNTGAITPLNIDVEAIEAQYAQYESKLVTLHNVTFTEGGTFTTASASNMNIEQNGETMQVRNTFKTLDLTIPANYVADVTGFVLCYTNNNTGVTTYQIAPRDNNDIVGTAVEMDTVATPVISVEPLTNAMFSATIECETDDAVIYYTVDGNDPDENATAYSGSFVVDGGRTIKAIAVKEGMANSDIAIYANTGISDITSVVSIAPNPTADRLVVNAGDEEIESICVFDLYGRMLSNTAIHSSSATIDLSSYSTGNYILRIATANGTFSQKVIKK